MREQRVRSIDFSLCLLPIWDIIKPKATGAKSNPCRHNQIQIFVRSAAHFADEAVGDSTFI